jgi:hypothetical protein
MSRASFWLRNFELPPLYIAAVGASHVTGDALEARSSALELAACWNPGCVRQNCFRAASAPRVRLQFRNTFPVKHELFACRPPGFWPLALARAPNARTDADAERGASVPALPAQMRALPVPAGASAYSSSELLVRPRRVPANEQNRWRCRAGVVVGVERMVGIAPGAACRRSGHGCGGEAVPCAARESERSKSSTAFGKASKALGERTDNEGASLLLCQGTGEQMATGWLPGINVRGRGGGGESEAVA